MKTVNIQEAKTHLSRLVELAANGETVVIGKAGTPVAQITAWQPQSHPRQGGGWRGLVRVSEDFDATDPEIEALFHGDSDIDGASLRVADLPK